jgi:putative transposase
MSNHYHRALETPEANLVQGMAWLQGTFANRLNRFHGERGHVFQSRYQSILIRNYAKRLCFLARQERRAWARVD